MRAGIMLCRAGRKVVSVATQDWGSRICGASGACGRRFYHKNVVDHYDNPRNVGSFSKDDPNVGTGLVGAPACGDVMKLQIRVNEDGTIVDSCFKTFGCGSAIASSSVGTLSHLSALKLTQVRFILGNKSLVSCFTIAIPHASVENSMVGASFLQMQEYVILGAWLLQQLTGRKENLWSKF